MPTERLPANDPRTVARDIPGIFDALFPQLSPGVVAHFNSASNPAVDCRPVPADVVTASDLNRAMLFEVAVVAGEQLIAGNSLVDWETCLKDAVRRQRRHFDAKLPNSLSAADKAAALRVASNLAAMLDHIKVAAGDQNICSSPKIPGFQWIASGVGDFSVGTQLIEVKCTNKHFSSSDYRQLVMYWLLGYASSVESDTPEWSDGILLNPRLNHIVKLPFDEIINVIGAGRSKVELLELFSSMVGDHTIHMLTS